MAGNSIVVLEATSLLYAAATESKVYSVTGSVISTKNKSRDFSKQQR
jgi:hypothetical protein